ncbi:MAG TPA: inositol monophosphatase family protein [archaeon]|nr:inositol monophosphatase family protein [archaeon]
MNEIETAKLACIRAGDIAMKYFRTGIGADFKSDRSIVTKADVECEKKIRAVIANDFPSHGFLGEEGGMHGDQQNLWVIDPIDGTTNFFHGVEQFAVSVAFVKNGIVQCGCVYNPVTKNLYSAQLGKGAFLNKNKIHVSKTSDMLQSLLVSGFPYESESLKEKTYKSIIALRDNCQDIRRFGSASLDMCFVAHGICDGFFEYDLKPWDVAAAMLIVREAGGRVTDINGEEAGLNSGHFLATNKVLHEGILKHLERV